MKKIIIYIGCISMLLFTNCNDYLDKDPLDRFTDEDYWTSEVNLRAYAQDFYVSYFVGYAQDFREFGGYFSGDSYNDDFLLTNTTGADRLNRYYFPTTNTNGVNTDVIWKKQYEMIRKANVMIERIPGMDITDEAKKHWIGIGRFFRALGYSTLVKEYGEVPYFDRPAVLPKDREWLYKDKDDRLVVVENILADFEIALQDVRANDGNQQVNKYVVGAFMSRNMLFHGTWLKYHGTNVGPTSKPVDNAIIKKYLDGAIKGADTVMKSGKFSIANTYNALFSSESLENNPEIIFYREYAYGVAHNMLMAYNAKDVQEQGGVTKAAINSYLCIDGLPISQSSKYEGNTDPSIKNSFKNRDPRLYDTFVDTLRITNSGLHTASSPTGYASKKFLNEQWLKDGLPYVNNSLSPADAPIIRYAEVLLNYVEARYEVSKVGGAAFTQEDINLSINKIRGRNLTKWAEIPILSRKMPEIQLAGSNISVEGTVINDPDIDPTVDAVLWEIRRERRIELMMEGRRGEDLNRWKKFEYLDSGIKGGTIKDAVLGAWIKKTDYPNIAENHVDDKGKFVQGVNLYNPTGDATKEGYILYFYYAEDKTQPRPFVKGNIEYERAYLRAVPVGQINDYNIAGYKLTQNPGWE